MRIIRGSHRGRQIVAPRWIDARPTTDFAKEGIFNILEHAYHFENVRVLDLFAGTGNISYEFASRGCSNVTAIEIAPRHAQFIRQTAEELFGKPSPVRVLQADVFKAMPKLGQSFDIIFADAPYDLSGIETIPSLVFANNLLAPDGILVVEHPETISFEQEPFFVKHRHYGSVHASFFEHKA